jgi:hypothetical protein
VRCHALFRTSIVVIVSLVLFPWHLAAQEFKPKMVFHPQAVLDRKWSVGLGFQTFATPESLTEEFKHRIPAGDVQVLRRIHGGLHVRSRALIQVLQNHATLGFGWSDPIDEKWSYGVGSNVGAWKGHLLIDKFDSDGSGWAYYPDATLGYHAGRNVRLSFRLEAMIRLDHRVRVGGLEITRPVSTFNGMAGSLYVEQPFFGRTHIALGFTARYTNFFWATWALFDMKQEPYLYRQITVVLIP